MRIGIFLTAATVLLLVGLGVFFAPAIFHSSDASHPNEKSLQKVNELIRDGDIIFQTSVSGQSKAIQEATGSEYSHCGIVFKEDGRYMVWEAIQPVKKTNLNEWIKRGKARKYVIKRLKDADRILDANTIQKMKSVGNGFLGKNYDLTFEWSDDRIYCSELVWKMYWKGAGIEVGKLQELGSFNLTGKEVKRKMKERYGDSIPIHETVISPAAIFECEKLVTIKAGK